MPFNNAFRWVVVLSVTALLCFRVSKIDDLSHRKLRIATEVIKEKDYYHGTALHFITKYGIYNRLFDLFFSSEPGSKPLLNQNPKVLNGTISPKPLGGEHRIRSLKNAKFYGFATAQVDHELSLLNFTYTNKPASEELNLFNNKFRYGPKFDDRFLTIVFDKDPVEEATEASPAYIFFVGVNTELSPSFNYICQFPEQFAESKVEIDRKLRNAINRETTNSLIRCVVPWSVSSKLNSTSTDVVLHLVQQPSTPETSPVLRLLSNIHVPRLHALDRRKYRYVVQTMLDAIEDPMLVEWVVYNIMLGVEHFYIYYNSKSADLDLEHSQLRPFLDANIITFIYFPYLHIETYGNVQHAALNSYLHQFGRYTEFVGFWDMDEFFLPTTEKLPYLKGMPYTVPLLDSVFAPLMTPERPAVSFNTLDMDCAESAGDNATHQGVTTHCQRTGRLFEEWKHGHGKMIVRPALAFYIMSPHRLNQRHATFTDDWECGMMRHFNRFKYTKPEIAAGHFSADKIGIDVMLRNFTLTSLKELVGITLKN